jgi:hypothetical protein
VFPRGGGREARNIEIEAIPAKIGGGNTTGVAPGCFSTLSDVNTIITRHEEGVVHLWTMGL